MSRRTERIAEQLRAEIARILREEATDPRTRLVTLTRVDVAPDLSNALVFLADRFASSDPETWLWGKIHQVRFQHFFGQAGVPAFVRGVKGDE